MLDNINEAGSDALDLLKWKIIHQALRNNVHSQTCKQHKEDIFSLTKYT